jgi:hypothetical protein
VIKLLFGSIPARFDSRFGLGDSVESLRAASVPWHSLSALGLFKQQAVGVVTSSRVRLRRVRPLTGGGLQFAGHFVDSQGVVALVGRFTMPLWAKVFMSIWFGFLLLWTLVATFAVVVQPGMPVLLPLAGVAVLTLAVLLVSFGSRGDVAWLSDLIRSALGDATR